MARRGDEAEASIARDRSAGPVSLDLELAAIARAGIHLPDVQRAPEPAMHLGAQPCADRLERGIASGGLGDDARPEADAQLTKHLWGRNGAAHRIKGQMLSILHMTESARPPSRDHAPGGSRASSAASTTPAAAARAAARRAHDDQPSGERGDRADGRAASRPPLRRHRHRADVTLQPSPAATSRLMAPDVAELT